MASPREKCPAGQTSGRYSYYRNVFDLEYEKDVSRPVSLKWRYGNEAYQVSRDDLSDSFLHHGGMEADYHLSSDAYLLADYDYRRQSFSPGDTVEIHNPSLGGHVQFDNQIKLDAKAGLSFSDSFERNDAAKLNLLISATKEVDEKTEYKFSCRKSSGPASSTEDVFDSWRVTGRLKQQVFKRLGAQSSVFYGQGRYETSDVKDSYVGSSVRMDYDLTPDAMTFVSYAFSRTDSSRDSRDYVRNLVSVGVSVSF
jgi:hypothetical protein